MKVSVTLALLLALALQVSVADDIVKALNPPKDSLYPMLEYIATRSNEYRNTEISIIAEIYEGFLTQYKEHLKSHDSEEHQAYKKTLEQFVEALNASKANPGSCSLQRQAKGGASLSKTPKDDYEVYLMLNRAINSTKYKNEHKKLIRDMEEQFPVLMKDFIESVQKSDEDKKTYGAMAELAQKFLDAKDKDDKYTAFKNFVQQIDINAHLVEANEDNCKWDLANFKRFVGDGWSKYMYVGLEKMNF